MESTSQSQDNRPTVLLLALRNSNLIEDVYSNLLEALVEKAKVKRAQTKSGAVRYLLANRPHAILVCDGTIVSKKCEHVAQMLRDYVVAGGIVIHCCFFSGSVRMHHLDRYFKSVWDLEYVVGMYTREEYKRNVSVKGIPSHNALLESYSQKALCLAKVPHKNTVYSTSARPPQNPNEVQAASTFEKFKNKKGWLGYIGDVNSESETVNLILSMLKLI